MAQKTIDNYLNQIFKDRRYCFSCEAMTPILANSLIQSGLYLTLVCDICKRGYKPIPLHKLQIQEKYGMAIFNCNATIKVVKL